MILQCCCRAIRRGGSRGLHDRESVEDARGNLCRRRGGGDRLYRRWQWLPGVDFDIIGFFWAIRNTPKIGAFIGAWMAGGAAVYCLMRAKLAE